MGQKLGRGARGGAASPGGQLHSQVPVDGDGQQGQDGGVGEHHHEAAHEEAAVEGHGDAQAHHDGQGHDQEPHGDVGQRQGHDEIERRVLEHRVQPHHPDHQDIAQGGKQSHQALGADVNPIQAAQGQAVVWHCELLQLLLRRLQLRKEMRASMATCGIFSVCCSLVLETLQHPNLCTISCPQHPGSKSAVASPSCRYLSIQELFPSLETPPEAHCIPSAASSQQSALGRKISSRERMEKLPQSFLPAAYKEIVLQVPLSSRFGSATMSTAVGCKAATYHSS